MSRILALPPRRQELIPYLRESVFHRLITEAERDLATNLEIRTRTPIAEAPLSVVSIMKQSPLEIVVWAIPAAVTMAVILSGGKIKYTQESGIEAELPPIGKGIKLLREALFDSPSSKGGEDEATEDDKKEGGELGNT